MKNRTLVFTLCISLCLFSFGLSLTKFVEAQTTILSINPQTYEVAENEIGNPFTVTIEANGVTNLWGWKTGLSWNPEVLNLTKIEEGPFLQTAGDTLFVWPSASSYEISMGYVDEIFCSFLSLDTVQGDGVLATITFESLNAGDCEISLNATSLMEPETGHPEIPHNVLNGNVSVIPEFQSWMVLPVFTGATVTAVFLKKRYVQ
jgi:hypothetical protein